LPSKICSRSACDMLSASTPSIDTSTDAEFIWGFGNSCSLPLGRSAHAIDQC
jgi:hypothetical protein